MTSALRIILRRVGRRTTASVRALLGEQKAATAIEYGLILALMAIAALGAFNYFGGHLQLMWNYVANTVVAH